MSDALNDTREPWDQWNLTPYVPDPFPEPPVSLCTPPVEQHRVPVVAYGEVVGRTICDARMTYRTNRQRGKFGRTSPKLHTGPCQRKAIAQVLYEDGSVSVRCKEHIP